MDLHELLLPLVLDCSATLRMHRGFLIATDVLV